MKNPNSNEYFSIAEVADMLSVSKETLRRWDTNEKLVPVRHPINNYRVYHRDQLLVFDEAKLMFNTLWDDEMKTKPKRKYTDIELFAGAGGLALGLEKLGFELCCLEWILCLMLAVIRKKLPPVECTGRRCGANIL